MNKVLYLRIYRRSHTKTGRKGREDKWAVPASMCWDGESRGISQLLRSPCGTRGGRRSPHNVWLWKSVGIPSATERQESAINPGTLVRANAQNFVCSHTHWALVEWHWLLTDWCYKGRYQGVQLQGEGYKDSSDCPVLSFSSTLPTDNIVSGSNTPIHACQPGNMH